MRIKKQKKTNDVLVDKVKDYNIQSSSLSLLINDMMHSGGFESTNLSTGINILQKMMKDMKCTKFLSFIGAIMSTGVRGIIRDMLMNNIIDIQEGVLKFINFAHSEIFMVGGVAGYEVMARLKDAHVGDSTLLTTLPP